jgi:hypothetical protein
MNEEAIAKGTAACRPELLRLYKEALRVATPEETNYLPLIKKRIEEGSIAELMVQRIQDGSSPRKVAIDMAGHLKANHSL